MSNINGFIPFNQRNGLLLRVLVTFFGIFFTGQDILAQGLSCQDIFYKVDRAHSQEDAFRELQVGNKDKFFELNEQLESLLKTGRVVESRLASGGPEDFSTEVYFVKLDNGISAVWKPDPYGWKLSSGRIATDNSNAKYELAAYELDKSLQLGIVPVTVRYKNAGVWGTLQAFVDKNAYSHEPSRMSIQRQDAYWSAAYLFDYIFGVGDRGLSPTDRVEARNFLVFQKQPVLYDNGLMFHSVSLMTHFYPSHLMNSINFKNPELQNFFSRLKNELTRGRLRNLMQRAGVDKSDMENVFRRRLIILQLFEDAHREQ